MAKNRGKKVTLKFGGKEITLHKSETQAAVKYAPGEHVAARRDSGPPPPVVDEFELISARSGMNARLDELRASREVSVGTHVWHVDAEADAPYIPTGKLYVEFEDRATEAKQRAMLDALSLNVLEIVGPNAWRVVVTPDSPNPITCALKLQKSRLVRVAEPDFATRPVVGSFAMPSGKFVSALWHFENTGASIPIIDAPDAVYGPSHFRKGADARVREAWKFLGSLGSANIRIAVIDTGFATEHPQLQGDGSKVRNPFNAALRNGDVSPWFRAADGSWGVQSHGTSCAAVAAGALDTFGISGAAPNARIIPIKLDVLSDDAIKNAFEHALLNGADVVTCSLGFPKPTPLSTYVSNFLSRVAREGRGGRGLPMFFAAGNANPASNYQTRPVSDFAAHPEGLCITASNSLDQRSSYSFYGSSAHNCAPTNGDSGAGVTTAHIDTDGAGKLWMGYTGSFGGTSSAAPLAAGICALMLSANPQLRLAEIKDIFRRSADKIGGASAYDASGHSVYFGYGRVNALRAVQMARELAAPRPGGAASSAPAPQPAKPPAPSSASVQPILRGRVVSPTLNVRSGPGTAHAKVGELRQGDIVELLEKRANWWRIGPDRFISADYIAPIQPAGVATPVAARQGLVNHPTLNVRSGPSTANPKVAELKKGDRVSILETSKDGWHRIGVNRWVLGSYINLV
ncbi:MAG: S8 family serine peptidase [Saprospiraceae bacterium]